MLCCVHFSLFCRVIDAHIFIGLHACGHYFELPIHTIIYLDSYLLLFTVEICFVFISLVRLFNLIRILFLLLCMHVGYTHVMSFYVWLMYVSVCLSRRASYFDQRRHRQPGIVKHVDHLSASFSVFIKWTMCVLLKSINPIYSNELVMTDIM